MAELTLTRFSAPSGPTAVRYEPSLYLGGAGEETLEAIRNQTPGSSVQRISER